MSSGVPPLLRLANGSGVYCALYKKGPAALPSNYRAIALLNGEWCCQNLAWPPAYTSVGQAILSGYDATQLGGRPGVPVGFAVAAFRAALELCIQQQRSSAVLFIDVQAAYYEVSRQLIFPGEALGLEDAPPSEEWHLAALADSLARQGALELLGISRAERALLKDCVACSFWHLSGSSSVFVASRGSRPGDGLADVLFDALFSIALRHVRRACADADISIRAAGEFIGITRSVLPLGWADDLVILADFDSPCQLEAQLPAFAGIVVSTLELLKFRINFGAGKTELLLDIRPDARAVRGTLLIKQILADGCCRVLLWAF